MRSNTAPCVFGKQILLVVLAFAGSLRAQTFNWNGSVAGQVWTNPSNWVQGNTPGITSIAVIDGGSGTFIALRESASPGSVSVGTLILTNPSYTRIVSGASAATLNFGTNAGLVYARDTASLSPFGLGHTSVVTANLGDSLTIRFDELGSLQNFMRMTGTGSVSVSTTVNPTFFERAELDLYADSNGSLSTFSGGMTIDPGVVLGVAWDGAINGSGTLTSGPMGTGTVTLKTSSSSLLASLRGMPEGPDGGERMIGNAVVLQSTTSGIAASMATCGTMNLAVSGPVIARNSSGSIGLVEFAVADSDSFPGVGTGTHSLTLSGAVTADGWTSTGLGTLVLAADNSSTLAGVGTIGLSVVNAGADGAFGSTSSAVYARSLFLDGGNVIGGQIGFI
jgi:hypothetical protein